MLIFVCELTLLVFLVSSAVLAVSIIICFFFKQKTAYKMRISDWSSDVCSSDLAAEAIGEQPTVPVVHTNERGNSAACALSPTEAAHAALISRSQPQPSSVADVTVDHPAEVVATKSSKRSLKTGEISDNFVRLNLKRKGISRYKKRKVSNPREMARMEGYQEMRRKYRKRVVEEKRGD